MSTKKIPKRVEVRGKWYDVRGGYAGKLEFFEYMKSPEFTADEPFAHMRNFYYVYDGSGTKVAK